MDTTDRTSNPAQTPAPVLRGTFQQQSKQLAGWLKEINPSGTVPESLR